MQEDPTELRKHPLVVIDRHRAVAETTGMALARLGPFSVVDEICDANAVRTALKTIQPALIVTDLSLPGGSANDWLGRLRRASGKSRILIFADSDDSRDIAAAADAGPD
jgi:DNA-binding NarL/FixJ family response regulator